jgi:hypothetical protein
MITPKRISAILSIGSNIVPIGLLAASGMSSVSPAHNYLPIVGAADRRLLTFISRTNPDVRIRVEAHAVLRATPQSLYRGDRRIDIIEIMDQWYGPGYRYVKVKGHDSSVYLLRLDEINDQWELIMFSTARVQRLATRMP